MLIFDIEADHLLYNASKIWCIVAYDRVHLHIYHVGDDSTVVPTNAIVYKDLDKYLKFLSDADALIGHNIINYDLPLLKKLHDFNYEINIDKIKDTHIMSRLFYPDREEHSLAYFGEMFRFPKGDHKNFTCFSQAMLDYCIRDVLLSDRVYQFLLAESEGWDWSEALKLEYNIWDIQTKQEMHGVLFDVTAANKLYESIIAEISDIDNKIISEVPLKATNKGELKKIFLKSGDYTNPVKEWVTNGTIVYNQ